MTSLLGAHSLATKSGLSEPEIGLEHNKKKAKFARCSFAKTTANCFNCFCHFYLISSVSRPQRPLIYDYIYFSFPNPPGATISRWEIFIPKVPLETSAPPTFRCFLRPCPQSINLSFQFRVSKLEMSLRRISIF